MSHVCAHRRGGGRGAALWALLLTPTAVCAQVVPGGSGAPLAQRAQAEYRARILEQIQERLVDWREAWNTDDAEALTEFYTEDAVLRPPRSGALRGRALIGRFLTQALPLAGEIRTGLYDLEGSGRLAYIAGTWEHDQDGRTWHGDYALVLEAGRVWRIRAQLFYTRPEAEAPGLPALGQGGSEFSALNLSREEPEVQQLLDRMAGAWLAGDTARLGALWRDDIVFGARDGRRATGRAAALALWEEQRQPDEGVQDIVIDAQRSERFAYVFAQTVVSWTEDGLRRTRSVPVVQILYREGDRWGLRAYLPLD